MAPTLPLIEYDDGAKSGLESRPPALALAVSGSVEALPLPLRPFRRPLFLNPLAASQIMLSGMMCRLRSRATSGISSSSSGSPAFSRKMRRSGAEGCRGETLSPGGEEP